MAVADVSMTLLVIWKLLDVSPDCIVTVQSLLVEDPSESLHTKAAMLTAATIPIDLYNVINI